MPTTTFTIKTRSTHAFALVKVTWERLPIEDVIAGRKGRPLSAAIVGYAASEKAAVLARARKLGALVVPIVNGAAVVEA